ncbi:MAG: CPBP family intramembrane metalloprotease [Streptococcaceae bacterium]|jgi:membrane protease YdiL (CAAX protease family)|nr:CPBP family intramembrane metalloprotease [Streptococcaceae bacterium]
MKKLIKIVKGIASFLMFFIISQLSPSCVIIAIVSSKSIHKPMDNLVAYILVIAILINVWLILYVAGRYGFKFHFDFLNIKTMKIILLAIFSMTIVVTLGSMLSHANTTANDKILQEINKVMPQIVMFFMTVVGAPIMEEITFRGVIIGKLFKNIPCLGLILSSLLFGLAHGPNDLGSWVGYGGMGLVLGLVYLYTKRLEINICIHFLWNLFAISVMFIKS